MAVNRVVSTTFMPLEGKDPSTDHSPTAIKLRMSSGMSVESAVGMYKNALHRRYPDRVPASETPVLYDIKADGRRAEQVPLRAFVHDTLAGDLSAYRQYTQEGSVHVVRLGVLLGNPSRARQEPATILESGITTHHRLGLMLRVWMCEVLLTSCTDALLLACIAGYSTNSVADVCPFIPCCAAGPAAGITAAAGQPRTSRYGAGEDANEKQLKAKLTKAFKSTAHVYLAQDAATGLYLNTTDPDFWGLGAKIVLSLLRYHIPGLSKSQVELMQSLQKYALPLSFAHPTELYLNLVPPGLGTPTRSTTRSRATRTPTAEHRSGSRRLEGGVACLLNTETGASILIPTC
jgi:hypothetical protein